jgi:hypothetical protein
MNPEANINEIENMINRKRELFNQIYKKEFGKEMSIIDITIYDSGILAGLTMMGLNTTKLIALLANSHQVKYAPEEPNIKKPIPSPYASLL